MEWFRSPPAASPRASTCAHLREGGLGRGRVCSIDRRPSTSITECARTPTAHHTPLISVSRATSLSSLSSLSLLFLPSLSRPNSGYVYTLSSLLDRYSPLFLFSNQLLRTRRKKRKKRRKKKKRYIKGRYRSFFSSTRSPLDPNFFARKSLSPPLPSPSF